MTRENRTVVVSLVLFLFLAHICTIVEGFQGAPFSYRGFRRVQKLGAISDEIYNSIDVISARNLSLKASSRSNDLQILNEEIKKRISRANTDSTIDNDWDGIRDLMQHIVKTANYKNTQERKLVHDSFRLISSQTFRQPTSLSWDAVKFGLEMMELQVSVGSIPRSLCLQALKALNIFMRNTKGLSLADRQLQANSAFRILQRLCTGVGLHIPKEQNTNFQISLDERDFCMVLNGFVNVGDLQMAHRVVALQCRTDNAPPLSPIGYSILIKGHGRQGDIQGVDELLARAKMNDIEPDIIMYNSLIDAYINCDEVSKAYSLFKQLKELRPSLEEQEIPLPTPNLRSYNTMLKGFAKAEDMESALSLAKEMEKAKLWDSVTTNTLVNVAIATQNFAMAESILERYTIIPYTGKKRWHPNVEAYTQLIGGYSLNGDLENAKRVFKLMKERDIDPNEYTYTTIMGALAREWQTSQIKKLLVYMKNVDALIPSVVTYNAILAGIIEKNNYREEGDGSDLVYNKVADDVLDIFQDMLATRVTPNEITASLLVDALGYCKPSRLDETRNIISKMDENGLVNSNNVRISTSMIRAYSKASDIAGAQRAFDAISEPDTIAFNALLSAYCDSGSIRQAMNIYRNNLAELKNGESYISHDVATYTIFISSLLKIGSTQNASKMYNEMKKEGIAPDTGAIDA